MLLRWMCKGLGALIFPFCDQVIYFESFETQKIICHHFCFGGDESGDHRTSAYSGGGLDKILVHSQLFNFFFLHVLNHPNMQKIIYEKWGVPPLDQVF